MRRIRQLAPVKALPATAFDYGCHREFLCVEKKQYADGGYPRAGLTNVDGTLYGVASTGGGRDTPACLHGLSCGTVFSVTTSGKFAVLYRFTNVPDGDGPMATLTDLDGVLYGTTVAGGGGSCKWQFAITAGCGTIFSVKRSGEERVIYRFTGHRDGEFPNAQMTQVGQVLYGTTSSGGSRCFAQYRCGTVFKITSAGDETVLFRFRGMAPYRAVGDGSNPNAGLLYFNGMLYGTTERGGLLNHGTVFAITTDGKETVLHRFGGAPTDGDSPDSTLTHVSGTLYGTTSSGGAHNQGTVFAITMSGKVTILHCFSLDWDGANPTASLIAVGGRLYGTASGGDPGEGYGSVFSITPAGEFTVLHGFGPASPSQRTSAACKPERSGA